MMKMNRCPFCGSKHADPYGGVGGNRVMIDWKGRYYRSVWCMVCRATGPVAVSYKSDKRAARKAIKLWNERNAV